MPGGPLRGTTGRAKRRQGPEAARGNTEKPWNRTQMGREQEKSFVLAPSFRFQDSVFRIFAPKVEAKQETGCLTVHGKAPTSESLRRPCVRRLSLRKEKPAAQHAQPGRE